MQPNNSSEKTKTISEVTPLAIFENMNTQLRLAEEKHGIFLAANIALLIAISAFFPSSEYSLTILAKIVVILATIALLVAICLSLTSHYPRTKAPLFHDNLLYYGFCAKQTTEPFLKACQTTETDRWLAQQSIILAQITNKKYRLFKWVCIFSVISYICLAISLILCIVSK